MAAITCDFKQAENKVPNGFVYLPIAYPDALAAEFSSRNVEFFLPLKEGYSDDGLRRFEGKDADGYLMFFGHTVS